MEERYWMMDGGKILDDGWKSLDDGWMKDIG